MRAVLVVALALCAQTLAAQADSARADSEKTARRVRFLTDRRCSDCHTVAVLKMRAATDAGPDLSSAYADVPIRYGMPLERFFDQPAGVMRLVLGGRPSLGQAEHDSLVALFRELYTEQLSKSDSGQRRARPVDTGRGLLRKEAL